MALPVKLFSICYVCRPTRFLHIRRHSSTVYILRCVVCRRGRACLIAVRRCCACRPAPPRLCSGAIAARWDGEINNVAVQDTGRCSPRPPLRLLVRRRRRAARRGGRSCERRHAAGGGCAICGALTRWARLAAIFDDTKGARSPGWCRRVCTRSSDSVGAAIPA